MLLIASSPRHGTIDDDDVVKEFLDVFLEEFHSLPPNGVIEFSINLAQGMTLISKAPYRMAPPKLVGLIKHKEELLDNWCIWHITSHEVFCLYLLRKWMDS